MCNGGQPDRFVVHTLDRLGWSASRRFSKASSAGLLIVSVDSFDRARGSQADPPTRRHFRYEGLLRAACCSWPSLSLFLSFSPSLSSNRNPPFLIHVKASPSIKINRVDAGRQVGSLRVPVKWLRPLNFKHHLRISLNSKRRSKR